DYAKGGLTNIDDLAPACPKHNRMVGEKLGQYTTGIYRDGPLAGRCWWRRNAAPGAPPHPKRVNKLPDVGPDFTAGLAKVRAKIHRQPPDTGNPLPDSSTGGYDVVDIITPDDANTDVPAERSPSESRLRYLLTTRGL
ncbi:HNH endonuclease, partial [Gordonia sp. DT30]